MAGAGRAARVGHQCEELEQAQQRGQREAVARRRGAFERGEVGRERRGGERCGGVRRERLHPDFLRAVVFFVVVAAGARVAGGAAERLPVGRLVTGTAIPRGVDEGLDEEDGVTVDAREVFAQALRGELEQAAREVRAGDAGQQEEATVLRHEVQAALALRCGPAEVRVARFQVEARAAVAHERAPDPVRGDGGVAEDFADERRVVEVVVRGDEFVPPGHVGGADQLESHGVEQMLLRGVRENAFAHRANLADAAADGQPNRLNPIVAAGCMAG